MDPEEVAAAAVVRFDAATVALAEHRLADALEGATEAAESFIAVDGPSSPDAANALLTAGEARVARNGPGDLDAAAAIAARAREMLTVHARDDGGPVDTLVLRAHQLVGQVACDQARYADAVSAYETALELARAAFGSSSEEVGAVCNGLGVVGKFAGRFDEAQRWYEQALTAIEATAGPRSLAAATVHHNLAGLAHSRLQSASGLASGRLSVEIRREVLGEDHPDVAADRANLGGLLMDVGEVVEAEACFEAARRTYERTFGADHVEVAIAWHNLAAVAEQRGDRARAVELYRRALATKAAALGDAHPSTLITVVNLAYALDDDAEAVELLERAVAGLAGVVSEDERTLMAARRGLVDRRRGRR